MKRLIAAAATCAAAGAFAVPALAATRTVRVEDNVFAPKSITVAKGTTVKWLFRGEKPHNVVVKRGPVRFQSAPQRSGRFTKTLTKVGTYSIVCTIHSGMAMKVRVR
jgi:plastocyanin